MMPLSRALASRPRESTARQVACFFVLAAVLSGCSQGPRTARAVDEAVAREALAAVLTTWKAGGKASELRNRTPQIVVQDMSWNNGAKLEEFEILAPCKAVDANLHCPVRLQLQNPEGKAFKKEVVYVVGTDPVITVFRELF